MEECRPMIVDAALVRLTATAQLTAADFVTDEAAGTCRLTYEAAAGSSPATNDGCSPCSGTPPAHVPCVERHSYRR
jgi:hypothetical protein